MTWTDLGEIVPTNFKKITIESSNYNPNIDSDITITITVKDQNDEGVANWTVPLKIDGTSINNIVTNTNGVVTYTYTCSTWGLHTFQVEDNTIQIIVKGWKQVQSFNNPEIIVTCDGRNANVNFSGNYTVSTSEIKIFGTIDSAYRPKGHIYVAGNGIMNPPIIGVKTDGSVTCAKYTSATVGLYASINYPLANPFY